MDWDFKMLPWDIPEMEQGANPGIASLVGLGSIELQRKNGDCSVDLKLGRLGDASQASLHKWREPNSSPTALPQAPSKRSRSAGNGTGPAICSVDGCRTDLSNCKDYHKRHKVCEVHAKTSKVLVGGQEQRFCQQCSRFHSLTEFDEVKRSCRKRLDGHNRRRRKPQTELLSINSVGLHPSRGLRLASTITPQALETSVSYPYRNRPVKAEDDALYGHHPSFFNEKQPVFTVSYSRSSRGKQFPFLQGNDTTINTSSTSMQETSVFLPLPMSSESGSKMFADGVSRALDSQCALSLLSSPAPMNSVSATPIAQQDEQIPLAPPLDAGLQFDSVERYCSQASSSITAAFSCAEVEDEQLGSVLATNPSSAVFGCPDVLQVSGDESSENVVFRALSLPPW